MEVDAPSEVQPYEVELHDLNAPHDVELHDIGTEQDARALFKAAVDAGLLRAAASVSTSQQDVDAAANFAVDHVIRTDAGWRTGTDMTMMIVYNSHLVICGEGILYRFLLAS
jgi:hypothetical protein